MSEVGVLCTRVRLEEKRMIEALAAAGVPARQLPPCPSPMPVGPVPTGPLTASLVSGEAAELFIDRCQDRVVAQAILPLLRAAGVPLIDAGLASTADRLTIARTLEGVGIPRPRTMLVVNEESGLEALDLLGYPSTLLPITAGEAEIVLLDRDIAEAVLEHRNVLGSAHRAVSLIQAGGCHDANRYTLYVVGGRVVGYRPADAGTPCATSIDIAERAAKALGAGLIAVDIAVQADGPVVWDVQAVPEFRNSAGLGGTDVAEAIAQLVVHHRALHNGHGTKAMQEVTGRVVVTA